MLQPIPVRTALLSVSNKTDLVPLARKLVSLGTRLISTGGTAKALVDAGLAVTPIDQITGFPEMMDGRVKTLHPRVHGGLLALRQKPDHAQAMTAHGITPIDLICVNLYPFEQTVAQAAENDHVTDEDVIEQIDIGGPAMVRSAAKNHAFVTCVTDPSQYDALITELDTHQGCTTLSLRRKFAAAAFQRTSAYDTAIAAWMTAQFTQTPAQTDL